MDAALFETLIKLLFVLILISAALIIIRRDLLSLVSTYAIQSALLAILAAVIYLKETNILLLYLALLTLISKVIIIPYAIKRIQQSLHLKRDVEFHYLTPTTAIFSSLLLVLVVYGFLSKILGELSLSSMFFLGATTGVSLTLMGLIVIFSRKQTITNIVGYLTMENGVLLFSLFMAELPLIIEFFIIVDLLMLTVLATIFAFGIDSSIEEFHAKLNPFKIWNKGEK